MAREIKPPAELMTAADKLLEDGISMRRAVDLFKLALFQRAVERADGNESLAAKRMAMQRVQLNRDLDLLRVRLS
jgi:DNA-binding NtrC family response regulator